MYRLAIALVLFCCTSALAQKWSGKGPHQPASEAYLSRVGTIIFNTLAPELAKHPERLAGAVKVALRLDREGHVSAQKVLSTTSNHYIQDTALRVVRTVKLPPMPKQVATEQKHDWIDFQAEWSFQHDLPKPAAAAYQNQTSQIARNAVVSALMNAPNDVERIALKLKFQIDKQGRVRNAQIISNPRNQWAEQSARRALEVVKLPSPSKRVLEELGTDWVNAEAELEMDRRPKRAN